MAPLELARHLDTAVWVFDIRARRMRWANPAAARLWGADHPAGLLARDFASDMSEATEARLDAYLGPLAAGETIQERWTFYPTGAGRQVADCRCLGVDWEGELCMLVEARPLRSEALDAADLRALEALRHTSEPIVLADLEGETRFANPAAHRVFGPGAAPFPARFVDAAAGAAAWARILDGEDVRGEARLATAAGVSWFAFGGRRTKDPVTGEPAVLVDLRDIDALIAAREARAIAESRAEAKAAFLAQMSHEIRTPLTTIVGFTEELRAARGADEEIIDTIHASARHLAEVIDQILDLSKLEAGGLAVEWRATDVGALVDDVVRLVASRARAAGLELRVERAAPPEAARLDATRVRQILVNLLGNAIKFTPTGFVALGVLATPEHLVFRVEDSGVGMTPDGAARAFDAFEQADVSTTRRFGGTGLGLSISRRLARVMQGDLRLIRTEPDAGSVFVLTLPFRPTALVPAPEPRDEAPLPPGTRVLLAEDHPVNARLVHRILESFGARVSLAVDGAEALARAEGADVVLMDLHMPQMDGLEATRALRARGFERPIIALTAAVGAEDRAACAAAGIDEVCTKPVDRHRLLSALRRHLAQPRGGPVPGGGGP